MRAKYEITFSWCKQDESKQWRCHDIADHVKEYLGTAALKKAVNLYVPSGYCDGELFEQYNEVVYRGYWKIELITED